MLAALVTAVTSWATIRLDMSDYFPGIQVQARGLRWEIVHGEPAGPRQDRHRLRCLDGALRGAEVDILTPFDKLDAIAHDLDPRRHS